MIYVCDAIMGSGKSSAVIQYMNDHPDGKYIYVTPFLEEAKRIKEQCPTLDFIEPQSNIKETGNTKKGHTALLIEQGKNIASTHQALTNYSSAMLEMITLQGYELFIDENIDMLGKTTVTKSDKQMLLDAGMIEVGERGRLRCTKKAASYEGQMKHVLDRIRRTEVFTLEDSDGVYWLLPPELITSFKNVYILTYLFKGQGIYQFLQINELEYQMIGVRNNGGRYEFCDYPGELPEYTKHLKDLIHICTDEKLNEIGNKKYDLSATKFRNGNVDTDRLRLNLRTYFRRIHKDKPAKTRMWAVFKGSDVGKARRNYVGEIADKGYTNCFVQYNARATNKYRDKTVLAYLVNVFMNLPDKQFYLSRGAAVDEDTYALSVMIQWVWRSAIREGHEIDLYISSRRMREMFIAWRDSFDPGGDTDEA